MNLKLLVTIFACIAFLLLIGCIAFLLLISVGLYGYITGLGFWLVPIIVGVFVGLGIFGK